MNWSTDEVIRSLQKSITELERRNLVLNNVIEIKRKKLRNLCNHEKLKKQVISNVDIVLPKPCMACPKERVSYFIYTCLICGKEEIKEKLDPLLEIKVVQKEE